MSNKISTFKKINIPLRYILFILSIILTIIFLPKISGFVTLGETLNVPFIDLNLNLKAIESTNIVHEDTIFWIGIFLFLAFCLFFIRIWELEPITPRGCFKAANNLYKKVGLWEPDLIIGMGRSGGILGGWLAGCLGSKPFGVIDKKVVNIDGSKVVKFPGGVSILNALNKTYPDAKRVLFVIGASSRGLTINQCKLDFQSEFDNWKWDIQFAVLYTSSTSNAYINFRGHEHIIEVWPNKFPWHDKDWILDTRGDE